jgi:hypothetical protein
MVVGLMLSAPGVESGEFLRSEIAERAVRPDLVVVLTPCFDLAARVVERNEEVLIEAFVAQPSVEALDESVLNRFARFDELDPHPALVGPLVERPPGELRAVVGLDHGRQSAPYCPLMCIPLVVKVVVRNSNSIARVDVPMKLYILS